MRGDAISKIYLIGANNKSCRTGLSNLYKFRIQRQHFPPKTGIYHLAYNAVINISPLTLSNADLSENNNYNKLSMKTYLYV